MSARLLTFLPGVTFDSAGALTPDALVGVGASQGRLASAFRGFEHRAATNFMAWSLDSGMVANDELWTDLSAEGRACAAPYRERVESAAAALAGARRQIVHNDGHRGNLLRGTRDTTDVIGVIDFGDIAETAVIADLAICGASFVDGHPNQCAALCSIAVGYHSAMPLDINEVDLLADLVLTRIVLGLLLVEYQARHAPTHRLAEIAGELPSYRGKPLALGQTRSESDHRSAASPTRHDGTLMNDETRMNNDLRTRRESALAPSYQLFYDDPVHLVRGEDVWVTDVDGNRLLDCYNNVPSVGHAHPRVVAALAGQAAQLNTHTRYLHDEVVRLAERLGSMLPDGLQTCYFVCTGTEANDLAVEIARTVTGQHGVVVSEHSYHGNSSLVSLLSTDGYPAADRPDWLGVIDAPNDYRGRFRADDPGPG